MTRSDPEGPPLRGRLRVLVCGLLAAAATGSPQSLEEAQALFADEKLDRAAAMYRSLTESDPDAGAAWYGLGRALHEKGEHEAAAGAYRKAIDLGASPLRARYHFARLEASRGNGESAVRLLGEARDGGLAAYQLLVGTSEFAPLLDDPGFKAVADSMKPCAAPEYAHFDFWIGAWDVTTPDGQPAGENRISRVQDGCVLLEEWTSTTGVTGTSFNTFNTGTGRWQQFWVDAQGTVLAISGGLEGGAMVMSSDPEVSPVSRITWTPRADGSVRQHWETSSDGGATWTSAFDGIYRRKSH